MNIKTKFDVGSFAIHKHQSLGERYGMGGIKEEIIPLMEIMDIISEVCYAGTQVFYLARIIQLEKSVSTYDNNKVTWSSGYSQNHINSFQGTGYYKYREDELVPCPKDIVKKLKSITTEKSVMSILKYKVSDDKPKPNRVQEKLAKLKKRVMMKDK